MSQSNADIKSSAKPNSDNSQWLKLWRDKLQGGFHLLSINPLLPRFWHKLKPAPNGRVLVPLCGKSLDMLWLAAQGYQVVGAEISPLAVKAFFSENQLKPTRQRIGKFTRWQAGNITIWCGDFFALTPQHTGQIDTVFDRAALTALPEESRSAYLEQLLSLISNKTLLLLLTIEDIAPESPQACLPIDSELTQLCAGQFSVQLLHDEIMNVEDIAQNLSLTAHAKVYQLAVHPAHNA